MVIVAGAKLHIETLGRDPVDTEWKFGEVRFSKATYVHRAMNVGPTAFRNLTIELLKPTSFLKDASNLPTETGREPILENDRVRVYRVTLAPGEATPKHTHPLPGLSIALADADIEITTEGQSAPDRLSVKSADVRWRASWAGSSVVESPPLAPAAAPTSWYFFFAGADKAAKGVKPPLFFAFIWAP